MRLALYAFALFGCAPSAFMPAVATTTPLPAESASAQISGEHGALSHARPERRPATPPELSATRFRIARGVLVSSGPTFDRAVDKRVFQRLREPSEAPMQLPFSLTDLSLDDARR